MADDDNYTIEDDDEPVAEAAVDEAAHREPASVRTWAPPALIVLGLVVILLAGWCATEQADGFTERGPDKSAVFIGALTLPLSIVGALLVVSGILAFVACRWTVHPPLSEDAPLLDADG